MIDWPLAERLAGRLGGAPQLAGPDSQKLQLLVDESTEAVQRYTKLALEVPVPRAESITRAEWATANARSLKPLLDPAVESIGAKAGKAGQGLRLAASATLTLEAGTVLGLLSRRVLGQYDLSLVKGAADPPPRLLFVAPNLEQTSRAFGASGEDFLRWVAVHEVTHAVQFGSVDWLRPHLGSMAIELIASLEEAGTPISRRPLGELSRSVTDRLGRLVSERDPFALMLGRRERELFDSLQAAMTVVEGHAEHVMDAAGADLIPSLGRLRKVMGERRESPGPLWKLLSRLMGMEMKMRQYESGRRFCDEVVGLVGIEGLNQVWQSPDRLPTLREIERPSEWISRVCPV